MRKRRRKLRRILIKNKYYLNITILIILIFYIIGCLFFEEKMESLYKRLGLFNDKVYYSYNISDIPDYSGEAYVYLNNNIPYFTESDKKISDAYEEYSELDSLGRCGVAFAKISVDTMPVEERGNIGMIKPSGWHTIKYDGIDGNYLYNRCHLIGYQLAGENANEKNLITCTRQVNAGIMLEFENQVANYVKKTKNHVLYRVTPWFDNKNLVASGIQIEAYSIEDNGVGISFNVYLYNVQDGIIIDYSNGESKKNIS